MLTEKMVVVPYRAGSEAGDVYLVNLCPEAGRKWCS